MPSRLYIVIILVAAMVCGCAKSPAERQLDHAEAIMEEQPDSALTLLQQIDGTVLRGEPQARHALLLSQAYDKNYIDLTNDSLISIATDYYNSAGEMYRKMSANYYRAAVLMNKQDYGATLCEALNVEKMASALGDSAYLARTRMLIARAYLFSSNTDGAEKYFLETLKLVKGMDNHSWIGLTYYNLADLELRRRNFDCSLEYLDSAKQYIEYDEDVATLEIFNHIGLEQYAKADSIYLANVEFVSYSPQMKAYHILAEESILGDTQDSMQTLEQLLKMSSHQDSLDIAYVAIRLALKNQDYQRAYNYTNFLLGESNRVISELSEHSLYFTHLEHEKLQTRLAETDVRNKNQILVCVIIVSVLVIFVGILYVLFLNRSQKAKNLRQQKELLSLSSEYNSLCKTIGKLRDDQITNASTINALQAQIEAGGIAAQELFLTKYSWIEELGNIFLDAEVSKSATNRVMRDLKSKLDKVKTREFAEELVGIINKYRNNLMARVSAEVPSITDSERTILSLLSAHLSPRIISFILGIKPQSIYNAKHSIKTKLEAGHPALLDDLCDVF